MRIANGRRSTHLSGWKSPRHPTHFKNLVSTGWSRIDRAGLIIRPRHRFTVIHLFVFTGRIIHARDVAASDHRANERVETRHRVAVLAKLGGHAADLTSDGG